MYVRKLCVHIYIFHLLSGIELLRLFFSKKMNSPHVILCERFDPLARPCRLLLYDDDAAVLGLWRHREGDPGPGGPALNGGADEGGVILQAIDDPGAVGQEGHAGDLGQAARFDLV